MTLMTVRIIVVGGDDTGKTAFMESLGAVAMEESTTDEKRITFKSGDDLIRFVFVELPSDKFNKFFIERSSILPAEFNDGQGVALFFSYADHPSREPCNYWLKFLSTLDQGDGLKPTIVVVGNKADLMVAESPPAHFVSKFDCGELIAVDSRMSDDHKLHLSPIRVLLRFSDKMLWPKESTRENIDCLVPVASAPPVCILIPTKESQMLLKPVVLRVGQPIVLGRMRCSHAATGTAKVLILKQGRGLFSGANCVPGRSLGKGTSENSTGGGIGLEVDPSMSTAGGVSMAISAWFAEGTWCVFGSGSIGSPKRTR
eukprot:scaffold58687_cov28-Attheya_sp.AAC.1